MSELNPKAQVKDIRGIGAYLQAKDRIRWFRDENGAGSIAVDVLVLDIERGYAAVKASCTTVAGGRAENYGSAWRDVLHKKFTDSGRKGDPNAFAGDFLEFATTAAISRALAGLGYGTDDALDWEIDDLADAPVRREQGTAAQNGNNRQTNQAPNRSRALSAPNLDAMSDEELYRYAEGQYRKWQAKHPEAPPLSADIQPASDRPPAQASAPVESRAGAPAQGRTAPAINGAASLPRAQEGDRHENSDPAAHLATAEQIVRIRALVQPAGKTVDGLCADLRVVTLGNLSSERADKLIARLQELADARAQAVGA